MNDLENAFVRALQQHLPEVAIHTLAPQQRFMLTLCGMGEPLYGTLVEVTVASAVVALDRPPDQAAFVDSNGARHVFTYHRTHRTRWSRDTMVTPLPKEAA